MRISRIVVVLTSAFLGFGWAGTASAQSPRFDIQRFIIEGNTLIPQQEAEALVAPHAGPQRDFGDVQRALEALQEAYVALGYSAVRVVVPEQDLVAGQVRLQVTEARIRNVRIECNKFFDSANVRASIPAIKEGQVPNTRSMGANLQLANENPAKQIRLTLEAPDAPGQVDAVAKVTDFDPKRHTVFFNNTGNSSTGQTRAGYGFQHANIAGRDHVLNAQFVTSPAKPSDVAIYGLGYRVPLYGWNGAIEAYGGYSDVDSGTVQNLFTVSGRGTVFGMRYTQFLPRLGNYEHKVAVGLDYRDINNNVASLLAPGAGLLPDITYRPLSVGYVGRLARMGQDISGYATVSHNLPGGADGGQAAFEATRPGARARYSIVRYGGSFTQQMPADLLLRAVLNVQYSSHALIPGEQFGMGGADNVRGFFERELSRDIGSRLTLEAYSPDLGQQIGSDWKARMLVFYDTARGRDNAPQRAVEHGIASVGLGLRMARGRSWAIQLDWAHVVKAGGSRDEGKERVHFSLGYGF